MKILVLILVPIIKCIFTSLPYQHNLRLLISTPEFDQFNNYIGSLKSINVSQLQNSTKNNYMHNTQTYIDQTLSIASTYLGQLKINKSQVLYNGSSLGVIIMKPSKQLFEEYLYTPPTPMTGTIPKVFDPYPNKTIFKIVQLVFHSNPYRTEIPFPYPDSPYEVLLIDIKNSHNITQMTKPLLYLFYTGLITDNTLNDTELSKFMEQTRLLVCITRNGSYHWVNDGCTQSTILHPNGKVLVQCSCNFTNQPITIINDTKYHYSVNPSPTSIIVVQPIDTLKSAMLWLIIAITVVWLIFMWNGYHRDLRTFKRLQATKPKREIVKPQSQPQKDKIEKKEATTKGPVFQKIMLEENHSDLMIPKKITSAHLEELKQDSKKNSFIIQFKEEKKVKKKKTADQNSEKLESSQSPEVLYTEAHESPKASGQNLIPDHEKKISKQYNEVKQDEIKMSEDGGEEEEEEEYEDDDEEDEVEDDDGQEEEEKENAHEDNNQQHHHSKNQMEEKERVKDIKDEKEIKIDGDKKEEEPKPWKPLPKLSIKIFCEIFLVLNQFTYKRLHELFSIFYYYRRTHPRHMRFLINYCKILFCIGLCTQFAGVQICIHCKMLPLEQNIAVMMIGLLLVNWVENIAEIFLRSPGKVSFCAGVCVLGLMVGLGLYLIITTFIGLLPQTHQIWMYTFIIVSLLEMFPFEFMMIGLKCLLQDHLWKIAGSDNPILRVIYLLFWDVKVQGIWRRTHRAHANRNQ